MHPGEADVNCRYVPPHHRRRLMDMLGGTNVRLDASISISATASATSRSRSAGLFRNATRSPSRVDTYLVNLALASMQDRM